MVILAFPYLPFIRFTFLIVSFVGLREAEPVSRVVLEDGFDAVRSFARLGDKNYTLAFQVFIGAAAIVGVENAGAHHTLGHDRAQLIGGVLVHQHPGLWL